MTDWPEIAVLDVGHGNCSLIIDGEAVYVVDAARGTRALRRALAQRRLKEVDVVLLSHGDADHVGGLIGLLTNPSVAIGRVYLNPEIRGTKLWKSLRVAVRDARKRGGTKIVTALTTAISDDLELPRLDVTVLGPTPESAMGLGETVDGDQLSPNGMSAVIRIADVHASVLLPGDIDAKGLQELLADGVDLDATVLVFPHHGGYPGDGDAEEFARTLTAAVDPETVLFSLARSDEENPRPEIVQGLREAAPNAQIACTQLSPLCAESVPAVAQPYLSSFPGQGQKTGCCCAGTVEMQFTDNGLARPQLPGHRAFVKHHVPAALCRWQPRGSSAAR
jgi:beta-lactamase superfamily II metal-dependent hydrolase